MTRRAVFVSGAFGIAFAGTAGAQAPRPTRDKLQRMINRAYSEPDTIRFSRPQVLGFQEELVTRQIAYGRDDLNHHFAVAEPRRDDDLIFFTNQPAVRLFKMHRTGMHLRRVASALNDASQTSGLEVWAGPECDSDFAAQLTYWARFNI